MEFKIGDIVFLITDPEQMPRMITRITQQPLDRTYCLNLGVTETWHYAIEMSHDLNEATRLGIVTKKEQNL